MNMKLIELEITTPHAVAVKKLYCDLDGVLVDFVKMAQLLVPGFSSDNAPVRDKKAERKLWQTVGWMAKNDKPFWGVMDPLPDAFILWDFIKPYRPEILSATGKVGKPIPEKTDWVKRHLSYEDDQEVIVHLVETAASKALFAATGCVLIDDKMKAIQPWIDAGGIGVLHISAEQTIAHLKELGFT